MRELADGKAREFSLQVLADAGAVLGRTLDLDATLATAAAFGARHLADACVIDAVEAEGPAVHSRAVFATSRYADTARALERAGKERLCSRTVRAALEAGHTLRFSELDGEELAQHGWGAKTLALDPVAPRSMLVVPLVAHGRTLGVLLLYTARRYGSTDQRLAETLGDRVAVALENARIYACAKEALQVRDELLGAVAHDLRTPLHAISLAAGMLDRRLPEAGASAARRALEAIARASQRADLLIQDLFDAATLGTGRLTLARRVVPAEALVFDAAEAMRPITAAAGLRAELDLGLELGTVSADRERILRVFENLIGNAAKFSPALSAFTVGARPRGDAVLYWVADAGPGIPPEARPRLFDRYFQVRRSAHGGAGLGLAICKDIVEAHGGTIWVESDAGRGSTFFFTLPREPAIA